MRKVMVLMLLAVSVLLGPAPAAGAATPLNLVVEDTAGVLDQQTLRAEAAKIDFYEPTTVAVYTYRGSAADNLNEAVLAFARAEHPDWISSDGQKWADGLYLFALDPQGRHVGTYLGEDRKVTPAQRNDIQDATKELFQDAQWTEGTVAGIRKGAELINRPWYRSGLAIFGTIAAVVVVAGGSVTLVAVRRRNQAKGKAARERGDRSLTSVTLDLDATEVNARTIPTASTHGALVLEKYRGFLARYGNVHRLQERAAAMTDRDLSAGRNVKVVEAYAASAAELDALDDVIADANAFLNRGSRWAEAWDRQVAPLREDLDALEDLLGGPSGQRDSATGAALLSFREATRHRLEQWSAELAQERLSPDDALDRLRQARTELTDLLQQHSRTVIDSYAKDNRQAEVMRRSMEKSYRKPVRPRASILDTVGPGYSFYSVGMFNAGFSSARSSVASTGSGSTTGYGSSGGSFSGSGSSSSF
jgi:hypothetical protein